MDILILSDIHGNLEALKAIQKAIENLPVEAILLLGDIIDYGPHSNEVISFIKQFPQDILCNIRGNHEESILKGNYERFSSRRGMISAKYTKSHMDRNTWDYIQNIMLDQAYYEFFIEDKRCLAIHGSLQDPYWIAIGSEMDLEAYGKYDYVFSGHSHISHMFSNFYVCDSPVYRNRKRTVFVNPGSVGQPRNHNPRAQFALWNTTTDEFRMCAVDYNTKAELIT